jgi:DNA-binding PadR family transcriptional regulator
VPSADEQLAALLQRRELMQRVLNETGNRRELASASERSQSTVYRALRQLSEAGLLSEHNGYYDATEIGAYLFKRVQTVHTEATTLADLGDTVSPSVFDTIHGCLFRGGVVKTARRYEPQKPLEPVSDILDRNERVCVATSVLLTTFERFDLTAVTELLVEQPTLERRPNILSAENLASVPEYIGVVDREIEFVLLVSEVPNRECCVVILDNGSPCVSIHNTSADAVQWADGQYRWLRQQSDPVASGDDELIPSPD